jgi:hypothetical protein
MNGLSELSVPRLPTIGKAALRCLKSAAVGTGTADFAGYLCLFVGSRREKVYRVHTNDQRKIWAMLYWT